MLHLYLRWLKLPARHKFRHRRLHFVKEFSRSMMGYNLVIEVTFLGLGRNFWI